MNKRHWWVVFGVSAFLGVLIIAAVLWVRHSFERVAEDVEVAAVGAAKTDPYYRLRKILLTRGIKVQRVSRLQINALPLEPGDALLLGRDIGVLSVNDSKLLIEWTKRGGHLLIRPPANSTVESRLATFLDLRSADGDHCAQWRHRPSAEDFEQCANPAFQSKRLLGKNLRFALGSKDTGYVMSRSRIGRGSVGISGDFQFMLGAEIEKPGATELAWQMLSALKRGATLYVVEPGQTRWYVTFWREAWPIWLPLLLALIAFIAGASLRFGPTLAMPEAARRSLGEHLLASARFARAHGHTEALLKAYAAHLKAPISPASPFNHFKSNPPLSDEQFLQAIRRLRTKP